MKLRTVNVIRGDGDIGISRVVVELECGLWYTRINGRGALVQVFGEHEGGLLGSVDQLKADLANVDGVDTPDSVFEPATKLAQGNNRRHG
jgi:hypothetical protein